MRSNPPAWGVCHGDVFEVNPLTCKRCGAEMKVISVITEGALIDQLLKHVRHRAAEHGDEPFDARAPPAA